MIDKLTLLFLEATKHPTISVDDLITHYEMKACRDIRYVDALIDLRQLRASRIEWLKSPSGQLHTENIRLIEQQRRLDINKGIESQSNFIKNNPEVYQEIKRRLA